MEKPVGIGQKISCVTQSRCVTRILAQCGPPTRCTESALTFRQTLSWEQINLTELKIFGCESWARKAHLPNSRRGEDSRKIYPTLTLTHERCLLFCLYWYILGCSRNGKARQKCQVRIYGLDKEVVASQTWWVVGYPSHLRLNLSFSSGHRLLDYCSILLLMEQAVAPLTLRCCERNRIQMNLPHLNLDCELVTLRNGCSSRGSCFAEKSRDT